MGPHLGLGPWGLNDLPWPFISVENQPHLRPVSSPYGPHKFNDLQSIFSDCYQSSALDIRAGCNMGMKLGWVGDCWSLFVTNLSPVVTSNNLFTVFRGQVQFLMFSYLKTNDQEGVEVLDLCDSKLSGMQIMLFRG